MKTIKVRIPVVCDAKLGEYTAYADSRVDDQASLVEEAREMQEGVVKDEDLFVSWVEAEVPVPENMQELDVTLRSVPTEADVHGDDTGEHAETGVEHEEV